MTSLGSYQEWRQFRILARDGVRTLLNAAMLARDADPAQFALWTTALVATPPALYAFGGMLTYSRLRGAPPEVIDSVLMGHRMFFVVYSLIAAALLAAATWDALYPDRDDHEILGALPIRPRTVTAARLVAALGVATAFGMAINLPSAALFAFASGSVTSLTRLPLWLLAHFLATVLGCVTMFSLLILLRAVVSLVLGNAVTDRLATGLQLVTVIALVEIFFYLPSLLPGLIAGMEAGAPWTNWVPATWFGAIFSLLAGAYRPAFPAQAAMGVGVLVGTLALLAPLYLLPARIMAHRTLESQSGRRRAGVIAHSIRVTVSWLAGTARSASVARFALTSLLRSRRHGLVVVTYTGVGVALALIQVIAAGLRGGVITATPTRSMLAAPLIVMFFVAAGMRAAFKVARDFDANWIFRLLTPTTAEAARGTRAALLAGAILPVVAVAGFGAQLFGWPIGVVARVIGLTGLLGAFLLECMLYGWTLIPFACARPTGSEAVRVKWLAAIGPFLGFTIVGAGLSFASLSSWAFTALFAAAIVVLTAAVHLARRARLTRERVPFDAVVGHIEVLNLSEALH